MRKKKAKKTDKLPLRYERRLWEAPVQPEPGAKRFRVETVDSVSDRANHWPGNSEDYFYECEYDGPEETPEYTGKLGSRESISLNDINKKVEELGLDVKNVFLTASFEDDYLCVEVVHIKEQTQAEIQEDYKEQLADWEEQNKEKHEAQLQNIKQQMEHLQNQADALQKKKKV